MFSYGLYPIPPQFTEVDYENEELMRIRRTLDQAHTSDDIPAMVPKVSVKEELSKEKRYGVCHDYALSTVLGIKGRVSEYMTIMGNSDWYSDLLVLEDYFIPTDDPQEGDIAVYYLGQRGTNSGDIAHTGIVCGKDCVESKWGYRKEVFIHPTFHVRPYFGNKVCFYRKTKSNEEIVKDLQNKLADNQQIQERCNYWNSKLIGLVEQMAPEDTTKEDLSQVGGLINSFLCTDANATNQNGKSLLELAQERNNHALAELLVEYGAKR